MYILLKKYRIQWWSNGGIVYLHISGISSDGFGSLPLVPCVPETNIQNNLQVLFVKLEVNQHLNSLHMKIYPWEKYIKYGSL